MGGVGVGGGGGGKGEEGDYTGAKANTATTRMFCIKTGSDGSRFNVSYTVRGEVTRQCPQTTTCK